MIPTLIISRLNDNAAIFKNLFSGLSDEEIRWKPHPEKWNLLEVVCHLYDEERDDFRARLKQVLAKPEEKFPSINPVAWVTERKYAEQNFGNKVSEFLDERKQSLEWLRSLENPNWKNAHTHHKFGEMSAGMFLANWLAHDYLHIRQILALRYHFLASKSGERMDYAGVW